MPVEIPYLMAELAAECLALGDAIVGLAYAAGAPDSLGAGGLAAGAAAAAAAAAASAAGTADGLAGGSNVGRNEATRPRVPSSVQARRDAQAAYDQTVMGGVSRTALDVSEALQKWAESIVGPEVKGTTPGGVAVPTPLTDGKATYRD